MSGIKSYAVIGLGAFGTSVARTLAQEGMEVMVIDKDKERINMLVQEVTYAMQMDVTSEAAMKNVGLERMDTVVIAIGEELEASVMATILCKEMGIAQVIVKCETELQKRVLEKVGADRVILPERESGYRLAKNIVGNYKDFFRLSNKLTIVEMPVKKEWVGKNLKELNFRNVYHLNIISIQHDEDADGIDSYPNPDRKLKEGDVVIAAGKNEDIEKL